MRAKEEECVCVCVCDCVCVRACVSTMYTQASNNGVTDCKST